MWPVTSDNTTKHTEIMITNQRVLIYPSPLAEKNRPKIIYLYEVNGDIEMKYNKASDTGNIYIPSPHWERLYLGNRASGKANPYPDIKGIKDPFKVYDILIEAIEAGKRSKWK